MITDKGGGIGLCLNLIDGSSRSNGFIDEVRLGISLCNGGEISEEVDITDDKTDEEI